MIRMIIAGGRDFTDYSLMRKSVYEIIDDLKHRDDIVKMLYSGEIDEKDLIEFISGEAAGADSLGIRLAEESIWPVTKFPANWKRDGKAAGFKRNVVMGNYAVSDRCKGVLVAFWDGKSHGTKHMIDYARHLGMEIYVIRYDNTNGDGDARSMSSGTPKTNIVAHYQTYL